MVQQNHHQYQSGQKLSHFVQQFSTNSLKSLKISLHSEIMFQMSSNTNSVVTIISISKTDKYDIVCYGTILQEFLNLFLDDNFHLDGIVRYGTILQGFFVFVLG